MIIDEKDFIEHHGVKGMHWGQRGTRRVQKILDRHARLADGTASKKDKLLEANRFVFTKKGASRMLQRGANQQAKINAGKLKVSNALTVASGVKIKNLDYHKPGDANAKLDNGQKAAVGVLVAVGGLRVAGALAKR